MSDQVIIKHKSNRKQLNESKDKYPRSRSELNESKDKYPLVTFTHKIYTKSISLVPHTPYYILLLHFWTSTQCLKWGP